MAVRRGGAQPRVSSFDSSCLCAPRTLYPVDDADSCPVRDLPMNKRTRHSACMAGNC